MRKCFSLLVLLAGLAFTMFAQEKKPLVDRLVDLISAPTPGLDPGAIYQPDPSWNLALTGGARQASIAQKQKLDIHILGEVIPASLNSRLKGDVDPYVGLQFGYGNLTLSYSQNIKKFSSHDHTTFNFDYLNAGHALQIQYFDYSQPMKLELEMWGEDSENYKSDTGETNKPVRMRAVIADAFYAFNRRTFAFSSVYKGNKIQCRSAGSIMFGTKFILGLVESDPADIISLWTGGVGRQTSTQAAFGAGASYNLVAFHRQPDPESMKGLRNLTFNLTAIPMVTLFNKFSSTFYDQDVSGDFYPASKSTMNGNLLVNYVVRAGAIFLWDRYSVGVSGSYDSYTYKGKSDLPLESIASLVTTTGSFSRWSASLRFSVRF